MSSWKRYFQTAPTATTSNGLNKKPINATHVTSWLPEVYTGSPQRIQRYRQYEEMDADVEVNLSLDTIAEFCTQTEQASKQMFEVAFYDDMTETEVDLIKRNLRKWTHVQKFSTRLWKMFRATLMYGDQFFVRDPETYEWLWVDPRNVEKVAVNEARGKKPEVYYIRDLAPNFQSLVLTNQHAGVPSAPTVGYGMSGIMAGTMSQYSTPTFGGDASTSSSRFGTQQGVAEVPAHHVVHLSLSDGMDNNWPFGISILECIYKTFKQKSLLEDAILIYRVHRAPERRVFYVDTGDMLPHEANAYLERLKNDINQRRIPSRSSSGASMMDSSYNPMSILEDYFLAQGSDGRGSKIETLPGGDSFGNLDDLLYFNSKMKNGLRVPQTYLPNSQGDAVYSDGRATTALIQEFRFSQYCERLQNILQPTFDREFKMFMRHAGVFVDSSSFELKFNTPMNFARYRQIEIDAARVNVFGQIADMKFISKRFAMKRWLDMNEDEVVENERMWREENPKALKSIAGAGMGAGAEASLSDIGIRPESDIGGFEEPEFETPEPTPEPIPEPTPEPEPTPGG